MSAKYSKMSDTGSAQEDVSVTYINATGSADVHVVVFETNVAWYVLAAQTKAEFTYPASSEIGAYYFQDNVKTTMGPFSAHPGSTWEIEQENSHSAAVLKEGVSLIINYSYS